jgi:hypothetical protein
MCLSARCEKLLALLLIAGFLAFFFLCSCDKENLVEPLDFFDTSKPQTWTVCTGCGTEPSPAPSLLPPPETAGICTGPNPTAGPLCLQYTLTVGNDISLAVYSPRAELIKQLVREAKAPGTYYAFWDLTNTSGDAVPNGVYRAYFSVGGDLAYGDIVVAR